MIIHTTTKTLTHMNAHKKPHTNEYTEVELNGDTEILGLSPDLMALVS